MHKGLLYSVISNVEFNEIEESDEILETMKNIINNIEITGS